MRVLVQLAMVLALAHRAVAAAPQVEDRANDALEQLPDPKCDRGECRPARFLALDEDDPKLARELPPPRRPTGRVELSYRFLQIGDPYDGGLSFHMVELDGYPVSGIFRLGLSLAAGGGAHYDSWLALLGLSVGVQYPARVTPFLDVRFAVGALGASLFDRSVVSYALIPGIEGGINVFLKGRAHLVFALGWAHPIYGGVDANVIQMQLDAHQKPTYDIHNVAFDTVTARVGLGF